MSKFDVEFDKPSMRIGSRKWWTAVQNDVGKNSEQYREAQSFTYYHTKVRVERRNDLSIDNPGWAVIFENSDWWALYFERGNTPKPLPAHGMTPRRNCRGEIASSGRKVRNEHHLTTYA